MIHPTQVPLFFARVAAMLVPGGVAFVLCDAPNAQVAELELDATGDSIVISADAATDTLVTPAEKKKQQQHVALYNLYQERAARGEAFPGYLAGTSYTRRYRSDHDPRTSRGRNNQGYRELNDEQERTLPPHTVLRDQPFREMDLGRQLYLTEVLHPTDRAVMLQTRLMPIEELGTIPVRVEEKVVEHIQNVMDVSVIEREARGGSRDRRLVLHRLSRPVFSARSPDTTRLFCPTISPATSNFANPPLEHR